jgi:hypothetical protein
MGEGKIERFLAVEVQRSGISATKVSLLKEGLARALQITLTPLQKGGNDTQYRQINRSWALAISGAHT